MQSTRPPWFAISPSLTVLRRHAITNTARCGVVTSRCACPGPVRLATLSPSAPRCSFLGSAQVHNSVAFGSSLLFSRFRSSSQLCRLRLLVALFRFDQSARNSVAFGSSLLIFAEIERRLTETDADGRTSNNCVSHHQHTFNTE